MRKAFGKADSLTRAVLLKHLLAGQKMRIEDLGNKYEMVLDEMNEGENDDLMDENVNENDKRRWL